MDEIRLLGTLLAEPEPSQEVVDNSMRALRQRMNGHVPLRRRIVRPAIILGAAAVTATAAVAVAALPEENPASPHSPPSTATVLDGRAVLLAAAATAEKKPASAGTYWKMTQVHSRADGAVETAVTIWTRRDGQSWVSYKTGLISRDSNKGRPKHWTTRFGLSFDKLAELPTDPKRLKAVLAKIEPATTDEPGPPRTADDEASHMLGKLMELISRAPAPPKVRAAAFRALATLPNVKSTGKVEGGYGIVFAWGGGGSRFVVDPTTAQTSAQGFTDDGYRTGPSTATGEWTNALPKWKVVPIEDQAP
ncbi:CU044_5270 family protein [Actinomadura sp. 6N118]|uniref:CU044_5270 family protein n=1 Tax=Actinomadura sp. 6N118 TaxID=3375151 RepID=UPI00378A4156